MAVSDTQGPASAVASVTSSLTPVTADRVLSGYRGDLVLAAGLCAEAMLEIRTTTSRARYQERAHPLTPDDAIKRIYSLADMCLMLPRRRPKRPSPRRRHAVADSVYLFRQANWERPMTNAWHRGGPANQAWILRYLDRVDVGWTPPPPVPEPSRHYRMPSLTIRQHLSVLTGWPVKPPPGKEPAPAAFRVLKALDRDAICAMYADEVSRGRRDDVAWLREHLDPDVDHYLVPDPSHDPHWPKPDSEVWHCRVLLRMVDGEYVGDIVTIVPETFIALPSTVPRLRQCRLVLGIRSLPRHIGLWRFDSERAASSMNEVGRSEVEL